MKVSTDVTANTICCSVLRHITDSSLQKTKCLDSDFSQNAIFRRLCSQLLRLFIRKLVRSYSVHKIWTNMNQISLVIDFQTCRMKKPAMTTHSCRHEHFIHLFLFQQMKWKRDEIFTRGIHKQVDSSLLPLPAASQNIRFPN